MKVQLNRTICIFMTFMVFATIIPPCPVRASAQLEDSSMEEAILLMITANARMVSDSSQFPEDSYVFTGRLAQALEQTSQKKVNEQRLLARYYLDLAKKLPSDSSKSKTFIAKAYAHNEMADVLQRRRSRENNPFQKIGRAITRPFKFIAHEIKKLIQQGIRLLEEVGPEIICDMIESYITTGTPINARIFFQKFKDIAMERIKSSLTNKAAALIIGVPKPQPPAKPKITVTTSRLMQTMTVRAKQTAAPQMTTEAPTEMVETEEKVLKYGKQSINFTADDLSEGMIVSREYFKPLITARTECGYVDFQAWEMEKLSFPLQIDLDKGTFSARVSGTGTDYLKATEITIPAWDFTATFTGEINDGTIIPNADKSGWILEGSVQLIVVPGGKMRCIHYPLGYPEVPAEYVWLKPDRSLTVEHAFHGTIDQQKGIKDGKPVITPGGKITFDIGMAEAEEDTGDYVFLHAADVEIPKGFPVP